MIVMDSVFVWVVASSLQASLLVVVVLAIQFALRKHLTAHWRYALWLPILFALVLPKVEVFLGGYGALLQPEISSWGAAILAAQDPSRIMTDSIPGIPVSEAQAVEATRGLFQHDLSFAVIWLVGTILFSAFALMSFGCMLRRVASSARPADTATTLQIERIATEIGLSRLPRALISPAVRSPAGCGLWPSFLLQENHPISCDVEKVLIF